MSSIVESSASLWRNTPKQRELLANCTQFLKNSSNLENIVSLLSNASLTVFNQSANGIDNGNESLLTNLSSIVSPVCNLAVINQLLALKLDNNDTNIAAAAAGDDTMLTRLSSNAPVDSSWIYIDNPREMLNPSLANPLFYVILFSHFFTFLVGVLGNIIVIVTWWRHNKFRSSTNIFLVSLAISDLTLLFICVPLKTAEYFWMDWNGLNWSCKTVAYVETMSAMSTVLNLLAVSIERFLVIVYPMKARYWCTQSRTRKGLIIVWALAFLLAAPMPFNKRIDTITYYNQTDSVTLYYCLNTEDAVAFGLTIYHIIVMFIVPGILLSCCYVVVIGKLKTSTRNLKGLTNTKSGARNNNPNGRGGGGGGGVGPSHSITQTLLSKNGQTRTSIDVNGNNTIEDEGTLRSVGCNTNTKRSTLRRCLRGDFSRRAESGDRSNYMTEEIGGQAEGCDEEVRMSLSSIDSSYRQPASSSNSAAAAAAAVAADKSAWQRLTGCCHGRGNDDTNNNNNNNNNNSHNGRQETNGIRHDDISLCTMSTSYPVMTGEGNSGARFIRRDSELTVQGDINNTTTTNNSNDTTSPELNDDEPRITASSAVSPKASIKGRRKSSTSSSTITVATSIQAQTSRSGQQQQPQQRQQHRVSVSSASKSTVVTSHKSFVRVQEDYSANVNKGAIEVIRTRTKVMQIIVFVVILFLVCWGPRLIMDVLQKFNLLAYSNINYNLRILFNLLSFCHSAVNPFVYGFMSRNFRAMVWEMLCGRCDGRARRANAADAQTQTARALHQSNTMEMNQMVSATNSQQ